MDPVRFDRRKACIMAIMSMPKSRMGMSMTKRSNR